MGLDNAVRVHDKMRVFYKEITRNGAKSSVAKWNLIGGMSLKHVKIAYCSRSAMIGYVLIGLRTFFSWYVMECKLFGVCVVSKKVGKKSSNIKMI